MAIQVDYIIGVSKNGKMSKFKKKGDADNGTLKVLNLLNIDQDDKKRLIQKDFNGVVREVGGVYALTFKTYHPENTQDPNTAKLIAAFKYLKATQKYELPPLRLMLDEMIEAEYEKLSPEEANKIKEDTDKLWLDFMQRIQDPEVQTLLQSIGQYSYVNHAYGWVFCAENIMKIQAQKPDATFLKTEAQWRDAFLRRVRIGAQPVWLMVPVDGTEGLTQQEIERAMSDLGYPVDKDYRSLTTQQKHYVDTYLAKKANKHRWKAYYDVSDTIPTSNDVWSNEAGLVNNLTGELNTIAQTEVSNDPTKQDGGEPIDMSQLYNGKGNVELLYKQLVQGIKSKYSDVQIAHKSDLTTAYAQTISNLADYLLETKGKIIRPENRTQGVRIATTIVLCLTKVQPEVVAKKLANRQLEMQDYFDLRNIINEILSLIQRNMTESVNENVQYLDSVDELLDMIGMTRDDVLNKSSLDDESKEKVMAVKESFDALFNRMKKSTYYNEKID